jgi:hypothetical protein
MSSGMFSDLCKQFNQYEDSLEIELGHGQNGEYVLFIAKEKRFPKRTIMNHPKGDTVVNVREAVNMSFGLKYLYMFTSNISDTV